MRNCFIIILFLCASNASSQLKISDLTRIKVGTALLESRNEYDKILNTKGELRKLDRVSSVYRYSFNNLIFNYCENTYYEFLYVNDILSNLEIEMEYLYSKDKYESSKFVQSLETILSSINDNNAFLKFQPKYSDLSIKKIHQKVDNIDSIFYATKLDETGGKNIYQGANVYFFESDLNHRFITLMIDIFKRTKNTSSKEEEIGLRIVLRQTTEKLQEYHDKFLAGTWKSVDEKNSIDLTFENGVYKLPVNLNGVMSLNFTLDLGASDVSISPDVFLVLYRAGTINESDFIGTETYKFADGSTAKSNVFNLKTLKIGDIEIKDVRTSISNNLNSPLLLGQSALKKLPSYKIDNQKNKLIID
ncbi:MAG: retroviral-like aspartic protease family protein [Chitinophagaceae bacterium]|nr:retroviral-like aspartic protease family protein [Chitinophagaceae bacterium]